MIAYPDLTTLRQTLLDLHRAPEAQLLPSLIEAATANKNEETLIAHYAEQLVQHVRNGRSDSLVAQLLRRYPLSSQEGLALMALAEAFLRVPDAYTSNLLIRDKLLDGNWAVDANGESTLSAMTALALSLTARLLPQGSRVRDLTGHILMPIFRGGAKLAMRMIAQQFVFGQTVEAALRQALKQRTTCSFDMLGEGARTKQDAKRHFDAYYRAIEAVADHPAQAQLGHTVSIKLSALHPRYEVLQRNRMQQELQGKLHELASLAAQRNIGLTIDAEECERLELSLDLIESLAKSPTLREWSGLSMAVQAYQKRAPGVIDWANALARETHRKMGVRLVKGAYWDMEIKRCQERGLSDFPVFTRKAATDVSYLTCVKILLDSPYIEPAFATHNAHTIACVLSWAETRRDIEFQRLHGMGEALYRHVMQQHGVPCRVYAPVGRHRELLPYLIRRMLENGANSGFMQQIGNREIPMVSLTRHPAADMKGPCLSHPAIRLPRALFPARVNSCGIDLADRQVLNLLAKQLETNEYMNMLVTDLPLPLHGPELAVHNPARPDQRLGSVATATLADVQQAIDRAAAATTEWSLASVETRAACLERMAQLLEQHQERLMTLLIREAGKTRADALSEVREAVDFCRYYASQARDLLIATELPGPVGESNSLSLHARGVFACISPWNFPLAIFLGQIAAALVAGNSVIAKPAPQTPLIAVAAVQLFHSAGIPREVLALLVGGTDVGRWIVNDSRVAGVAFTGSTPTARRIAMDLLSDPQRPLPALIAETGGINAMIVDSTALPEQVVADVITSAFQSAGQRCSALRLLCLQEDIFDAVVDMLKGAMDELKVGDPADEDTDIGPLIDRAACDRIQSYIDDRRHRVIYNTRNLPPNAGSFVSPTLIKLDRIEELQQEVFGPVLHVVAWKAGQLEAVLESIHASRYGLTLGLHSRIDSTAAFIKARARVGNIYINRSMIGAVVGSQPFGGEGLSGTGPKAGGPHYLLRFCTERTTSVDTTSAGGNASLMSLES